MCLRHTSVRGQVHHWPGRDACEQDRADVPRGQILCQEVPPDHLPSQPTQLRS